MHSSDFSDSPAEGETITGVGCLLVAAVAVLVLIYKLVFNARINVS